MFCLGNCRSHPMCRHRPWQLAKTWSWPRTRVFAAAGGIEQGEADRRRCRSSLASLLPRRELPDVPPSGCPQTGSLCRGPYAPPEVEDAARVHDICRSDRVMMSRHNSWFGERDRQMTMWSYGRNRTVPRQGRHRFGNLAGDRSRFEAVGVGSTSHGAARFTVRGARHGNRTVTIQPGRVMSYGDVAEHRRVAGGHAPSPLGRSPAVTRP